MVILLDKHKKPLGFSTERRVRKFFERKRAVLYRTFPTVVILKDVDARDIPDLPAYWIKIDPGSKTDGIAIVNDKTGEFVWAMQVEHRAEFVVDALRKRKDCRRNRRSRETPYRRCKYKNGKFPHQKGKVPPSIQSIIGNTETWVRRLCRWINITDASFEAVRFDTQLMDNPDIEGVEYQNGTLKGYEIREYLMEKYQHTCQYCGGESRDPVLEWEHKIPKSRGGSDKLNNATLSCRCCNQEKGSRTPEEWRTVILAKRRRTKLDEARLAGIQNVVDHKQTGGSNRYAAWTNITRKKIEAFLFDRFGDVECSSGDRTKFNRERMGFPKDHQYDALCIGCVPENGYIDRTHGYYTKAKAMGRGTRFRGKTNKCGIITAKLAPRSKQVFGFMNGDVVMADVPHREKRPYKCEGHYVGRVTVRANGYLYIHTTNDLIVNPHVRFVRLLQKCDGYRYSLRRTTEKHNQTKGGGNSSRSLNGRESLPTAS